MTALSLPAMGDRDAQRTCAPLCPHCGRAAARNGRRKHADGTRRLRYRCTACDCEVHRVEPRRWWDGLYERWKREFRADKMVVVAAELGVHPGSVSRWRKRYRTEMRAKMAKVLEGK